MFVLRSVSLTLSAAALVGAHSLIHAVIKRMRTKIQPPSQDMSGSGWASLPLEMQELILNETISISNNKQLLELTLTCKRFYTYISYSNTWTDRVTTAVEIDKACCNTGFQPKINFFFKQKRLVALGGSITGPRDTPYMTYGYHSMELYVPWLVNDFFKQPSTFWKFVRTIIVDPESIFKFLVQEDIFNSRAAIHIPSVKRIGPHLKIITIVLSILPWIDLFIAKSPIVTAITSATSLRNFGELIWNYEPTPIANMMNMSMPLFFSLLLNNSFYYSDLVPHQAALAIIMLLFNRGLKTALILTFTTVLPSLFYSKNKMASQLSATKYWWTPLVLIIGSLLYCDPIMSIYLFLLLFMIVWDMAQRALRPKQFKMRSAKWFLLGCSLSAISAIVVSLMQ